MTLLGSVLMTALVGWLSFRAIQRGFWPRSGNSRKWYDRAINATGGILLLLFWPSCFSLISLAIADAATENPEGLALALDPPRDPPGSSSSVSLSQIRRWCDGVAVSPDELQKRKRVRDLIGSFR
jgi:hypothetical protein